MVNKPFVVTAPIAIMLLAAPMMGSADDAPQPVDEDKQSIAVMNDGVKQQAVRSLPRKRARSSELYENLDCFYEENKAEQECREDDSSVR